jgi:hypothetical protein
MHKAYLIPAMAAGLALGSQLHANYWVNYPYEGVSKWSYNSVAGGSPALTIDERGQLVPGPAYDREIEAKKLVEAMRRFAGERGSICNPANYNPPPDGVIVVHPGEALPPLIIQSQEN